MAAHVGHQKAGGRKKGVPNKASAAKEAAIAASGLTPLDYMLRILRDESAEKVDRMWAAEKAAPYVHPHLNSVDHTGSIAGGGGMTVFNLNVTKEQLGVV